MLEHPDRPVRFGDLWEEVQYRMPMFYPGGSKLFPHLTKKLYEMFAGQTVTPTVIRNLLEGWKEDAKLNFLQGTFFDRSSCGVWLKRGSCDCHPEPGEHCRLKDVCNGMRTHFLASVTTLAHSRKDESHWLSKNLTQLHAAEGKAMLETCR